MHTLNPLRTLPLLAILAAGPALAETPLPPLTSSWDGLLLLHDSPWSVGTFPRQGRPAAPALHHAHRDQAWFAKGYGYCAEVSEGAEQVVRVSFEPPAGAAIALDASALQVVDPATGALVAPYILDTFASGASSKLSDNTHPWLTFTTESAEPLWVCVDLPDGSWDGATATVQPRLSAAALQVGVPEDGYRGGQVRVEARLVGAGSRAMPTTDAAWAFDPYGTKIGLYDDGKGDDVVSGDGIFSGSVAAPSADALRLTVHAEGSLDGRTVRRSGRVEVALFDSTQTVKELLFGDGELIAVVDGPAVAGRVELSFGWGDELLGHAAASVANDGKERLARIAIPAGFKLADRVSARFVPSTGGDLSAPTAWALP
jgi:hypothetical protein